jgi:type IV pilus assembly protein PilE
MGAITVKKSDGFSLIELMVVVAIVGVLAMIILPSYQSYVLKSRRTVAINAVMDLASREARYYTTNNAYTTSMITLGYSADPMPVPATGAAYYSLSVTDNAVAKGGFELTAARVGTQANDTCGNYVYNGLGLKSMSGGTASASDCWKQ